MDDERLKLLATLKSLENRHGKRNAGYIRAPFPYVGGKEQSAKHILPKLPYRNLWVDVFGGSGILTILREPSKLEIYNDRSSGVVAFYRCIRDMVKCSQLLERCELIVHSREEFEYCKETWKTCSEDVERAARWWTMINMSFQSKGFNFARTLKPPSSLANKLKGNLKYFWPIHERLKLVQFENLDWRTILQDYDSEETVFYIDPPWYGTAGWYEHEFTRLDHHELCERIFSLHGFVALSGCPNPIYENPKYQWSEVHSWDISSPVMPMAFTETNNLQNVFDVLNKDIIKEKLWIKK